MTGLPAPGRRHHGPAVLVTGLPRSGTSWVGKMLQAGGEVVYVNEPLNPSHPPGRSPGVLRADVTHQFQYIAEPDDALWRDAYRRTLALRYGLVAELRRNRGGYDLARAGKYAAAFAHGRLTGRRAMLDDPYAFFSTAWFAEVMDVRVVVLVRQPEAFVGSWEKLGWTIDFRELLGQPALVRQHLGAYEERMRATLEGSSSVDRAALLWAAAYDTADRAFRHLPGVHLVRYEDLAADPVPAFAKLYGDLELTWSPAAEETVRTATAADPRSGSSGPGGRSAFAWSWRGAPSRTAFQPMDSAAAAKAAARRLPPDAVTQVRATTDDVAVRFQYPTGPVP